MKPRTIEPELGKLLEDAGLDDTTLQWVAKTVVAIPHGRVTLVTHDGRVAKILTETHELRERPTTVQRR